MSRSLTESSNPLTTSMDVVDQPGFVRLLRQSDAQIFAGYEAWPSLMDEAILESLALAGYRLAQHLANPDAVVVFSGAGTSGRLAHMLARTFNTVQAARRLPQIFRSLIAGGDAALIQAQEIAEDHAPTAINDLKDLLGEGDNTAGMYFGITCGLSAPYVAAQVMHLLDAPKFDTSVVGFNPLGLARDQQVEGWDKTVKQALVEALENERFILLNPVYGPETVTGSTRMKGGTTTKIVLEIVYAVALAVLDNGDRAAEERLALGEENLLPLRPIVLEYARRCRVAVFAPYEHVEELAELVRMAGTSLRSGGRIHYLGRGSAGVLGIIDASECPPTFGANIFDVHGYLREGWDYYGISAASMRKHGKAYEIDLDFFEQQELPELSRGDMVVGLAIGKPGEKVLALLEKAAAARAKTALICIGRERPASTDWPEAVGSRLFVEVPSMGFLPGVSNEAEIALKLCLNAITTGGHVMAGKVYGNVMIDLRISNSKLYYRAIGLVERLTGVSQREAERALYQAVFREVADDKDLEELSVAAAVQRAIKRPRIVPLAILLAGGRMSLAAAEAKLAEEPRVRRIIEDALEAPAGDAPRLEPERL